MGCSNQPAAVKYVLMVQVAPAAIIIGTVENNLNIVVNSRMTGKPSALVFSKVSNGRHCQMHSNLKHSNAELVDYGNLSWVNDCQMRQPEQTKKGLDLFAAEDWV